MNWKASLIVSLITIAYMAIGGAIFRAMEETTETSKRANLSSLFEEFMMDNPCVSRAELINLFVPILDAYRAGILVTDNRTHENNWNLYNSIFFSLTVITTIGYGNIAPVTKAGRSFCVFYALVGIPLMLLTLAAIGQHLNSLTSHVTSLISSRLCTCLSHKWQKVLSTLVSTAVGLGLFFYIPAIIFWRMEEDWSYRDAVYYTFVTLLTIGFGDLVAGWPADDRYSQRGWYRILIGGWILVGLAWMSGFITSCLEAYQAFVDKTSHIKHPDNNEQSNHDGSTEILESNDSKENIKHNEQTYRTVSESHHQNDSSDSRDQAPSESKPNISRF